MVLLTLIGIGLIICIVVYYKPKAKPQMTCLSCNSTSGVRPKPRGSWFIELVLWCCFIIPGLIYTSWRTSVKVFQCPNCSSTNMIPSNTTKAKEIQSEGDRVACPFCAEMIKHDAKVCRFCNKELMRA